ncbi:EGF-like domain-containing protein [Cavenderia fasciculata]|uniref:EGF-like domain-containing protein n=1 Tax=Cavenderia fasciculata TaxID=261658 RepID=F4PKT7_CACFS|nr:EGF-like domain-containing protein [Cavenderia fasciculata]EGG24211.1 EGF-like domain-containing protein [Cavenderia fasciculata]|eukprot:XP_004362062.1 EGF-like domain-containing protein [Cavenderia fasciculata]
MKMMTLPTSSSLKYYFLFLLFIIATTNISPVQSQTIVLPPDELNSVIWLLRFYGIVDVGQTSNEICANAQFTCALITSDQKYHVTFIDLTVTAFQYVGEWTDLNMTQLIFPELLSLTINDYPGNTNYTYNPLDYLQNLPKLSSLRILNDLRISSIPNTFDQAFPILQQLTLDCENLTRIDNFFNITSLQLIDIEAPNLGWVQINDPQYLPNLITLSIVMQSIYDTNWVFRDTRFPNLYSMYYCYGKIPGNNSLIFFVMTPSVREVRVATLGSQSTILPVSDYPANIKVLKVSGLTARHNPGLVSAYPNLQEYSFTDSNITTNPFNTSVPASMTELSLANNDLAFSFPLPPSFLANSPSSMQLNLESNMGIDGIVPNEFCNIAGLNIKSTSVTVLPDCFWCYIDNTQAIQTDISKPGGFSCIFSVDTTTLNSIRGVFNISGVNIGWGGPSTELQVIIPNKLLQGTMNPRNGIVQSKNIVFNPNDPSLTESFIITEVGFLVDTVNVASQTLDEKFIDIHYQYVNLDTIPDFKMSDGSTCVLVQHNATTNTSTCSTKFNFITNNPTILASNQHISQSITFNFKPTIINSLSINNPPMTVNLNGYFGLNITHGRITINDTIGCDIIGAGVATIDSIQCKFNQVLASGPATITVVVPNGQYTSKSLLFIPFPLPTDNSCQTKTSNCNGHGTCINGQCVCEPGWYDNCKLQSNTNPDVIFQVNNTDPAPKFEYNDFEFSFNIIAVQELDINDVVIKELQTKKWNVTDLSTTDIVNINYELVKTIDFPTVDVITTVGFSNQSRTISFGGEDIQLANGAIKIGVNVTNWPFENVLSHLRVVFSTVVNNDQFIQDKCSGELTEIQSFQNFIDNADSLQYLRVVKDNVQFFGRFLEYSVSDGRKTYSKTEVMNTTVLNIDQSLAIIGIHLPQCQSCLLDPDFSALIVHDDSSNDECDNEKNNTWKIIVGVVVGAVGAAAIGVAIYIIIKKNKYYFVRRSASVDMKRFKKNKDIN